MATSGHMGRGGLISRHIGWIVDEVMTSEVDNNDLPV